MEIDKNILDICLEEAEISFQQGDVPIGAVLVQNNDKILTHSHNTREVDHNILGHAEINAILAASKLLKRWNLSDCTLYVTLAPCSMCWEVIKQSRISKVYYLLDKLDYKKEYNSVKIVKIDDKYSEQMYHKRLSDFFKQKR